MFGQCSQYVAEPATDWVRSVKMHVADREWFPERREFSPSQPDHPPKWVRFAKIDPARGLFWVRSVKLTLGATIATDQAFPHENERAEPK